MPTTMTGMPIVDCTRCGRSHPSGRTHCTRCGRPSIFQNEAGICLVCTTPTTESDDA